MDKQCRQLIIDNHRWTNSVLGREASAPCMFGDMLLQIPDDVRAGLDACSCFKERLNLIASRALRARQHCYSHNEKCPTMTPVDLDFSGLPCPDNSRGNPRRLYEEGSSGPIYAVWAQKHRRLRTPLLILENVPDTRWQRALNPWILEQQGERAGEAL